MVEKLKTYNIEFAALSIGKHYYTFDVDDSFFSCFENAVINHGKLQVNMEFVRQRHLLQFNFDINGYVVVTCDRCTEDFQWPISTHETLLVKIGDHEEEEDVDVYVIPQNQTHWNVAQQLYEYICMAKPLRTVHPENDKGESTCNREFINELERRVKKSEAKSAADPRWEVLRKISDN